MNVWTLRTIGCCSAWLLGAAMAILFIYGAHRNDHLCKPTLYPRYCVWCADEGREYIVDWITSPDSSAICEKHDLKLRKDAGIG